jgi:hypothetical protein
MYGIDEVYPLRLCEAMDELQARAKEAALHPLDVLAILRMRDLQNHIPLYQTLCKM